MAEADGWIAVLDRALSNPIGANWLIVVNMGNLVLRRGDDMELLLFRQKLQVRMPLWPPEMDRHIPKGWPDDWRKIAGNAKREVKQYDRWQVGICSDPRLRLRDGRQAARLVRRTVGDYLTLDGQTRVSVGVKGEADLSGDLTLELELGRDRWLLLPVALQVEVKKPRGRLSDKQEINGADTLSRGGIWIVATAIEEAIGRIIVERDRLCVSLQQAHVRLPLPPPPR